MIETEVRNNVSMLESVLKKLNSEIHQLEALIREKEVWEVVEERRVDELAEEGTMEASVGVERKLVTVLRGAERERSMLNGECSAGECSAGEESAVQCRGVQCSAGECSAVQGSAVQGSAVQCRGVQGS
jgi:hypothetical protein